MLEVKISHETKHFEDYFDTVLQNITIVFSHVIKVLFLEHIAMFVQPLLLTQDDSERNKRHCSGRKSSQLSISATIEVIRGTPGP